MRGVSTYIWLITSMGAAVNIQMSLLGEALIAIGAIADISLPRQLGLVLIRGRQPRTNLTCLVEAHLRGWRHPRCWWLLPCVDSVSGFFLDSLHQLIHLGIKADLVLRINSLVGSDILSRNGWIRGHGSCGGNLGVTSSWRMHLVFVEMLRVPGVGDSSPVIALGAYSSSIVEFLLENMRRGGRALVSPEVIWAGSLIVWRVETGHRTGVVRSGHHVVRRHDGSL